MMVVVYMSVLLGKNIRDYIDFLQGLCTEKLR